ncbi:UNKNOWN [Stylonychia lemnae]|uniref:Transmembrane protein n=1 Tax=Stylonychia lemnae TaxID=5949 RepID=A0A077ZNI4_STYLE|nr:UNKNOWN [Stylonychia lemnae]|eukprot:CDW71473.1 UNKNOWN [Stylonychia lemnae]
MSLIFESSQETSFFRDTTTRQRLGQVLNQIQQLSTSSNNLNTSNNNTNNVNLNLNTSSFKLQPRDLYQHQVIIDSEFQLNKDNFVSDKNYKKKQLPILEHIESMKQLKRQLSIMKRELPEIQIVQDGDFEYFQGQETHNTIKMNYFEKCKFQKPGDNISSYKGKKKLASFLDTQSNGSQLSQMLLLSQKSIRPENWSFVRRDVAELYKYSVIGPVDVQKEINDKKNLIEKKKIEKQRSKLRLIIDNNSVNIKFPVRANIPQSSKNFFAQIKLEQEKESQKLQQQNNIMMNNLIDRYPKYYKESAKMSKDSISYKDLPQFNKKTTFENMKHFLDNLAEDQRQSKKINIDDQQPAVIEKESLTNQQETKTNQSNDSDDYKVSPLQINFISKKLFSSVEKNDQNNQIVENKDDSKNLVAKLQILQETKSEQKLKAKSIKQLNSKYGSLQSKQYDILDKFDSKAGSNSKKGQNLSQKAEQAIDSFFFRYETKEIIENTQQQDIEQTIGSQNKLNKKSEQQELVTLESDDKNSLISKLQFEEKVRLMFDKDSLALKSLQEGVLDFTDKRVNLKAAAVDSSLKQNKDNLNLIEIDLGELKSLSVDQIHVDEIDQNKVDVQKGKQVVDDSLIDSQKYKLVMIGRKVSSTESESLLDINDASSQHMLSSQVFHESGEKFSKNIAKDEGVFKYYLRHFYLVIGVLFGVSTMVQMYQYSFKMLIYYEDFCDYAIFYHAKRGRNIEQLVRVFYLSDRYSVENRNT